jgi:TatD DNase family protein
MTWEKGKKEKRRREKEMYWDVHAHKKEKKEDDVFSIENWEVVDSTPFDPDAGACSLGIHPWKIKEGEKLPEYLRFIEQNLPFENVKAIGECGLDKRCDTPWEWQMSAFEAQIILSEQFNKPLIIHCVKAFEELIALHKKIQPKQAWIIHGFRGKPQQMKQLVQQGFYLSFGINFNEETIRKIPLDKLLLETDDAEISIQQVYKKVSECVGLTESALMNQLSQNCKNCHLN